MRYVRITKAEAKKRFATGTEPVYLCPCKIRPDSPWLSMDYLFGEEYIEDAKRYADNPKLWKGSVIETAWMLMYNNWTHYNASYETGYYPHYYITIDD